MTYNNFAINRYLVEIRRLAHRDTSAAFIYPYVQIGRYLKENAPEYLEQCIKAQKKLLGFSEHDSVEVDELQKRLRALPRKIKM